MDQVPPRLSRRGRKTLVRIAKRLKRELGLHDALYPDNIFRTNVVRKHLREVKLMMFKLDHGEAVPILSFVASFYIRDQLTRKSIARRIFG